MGVKAYLESKVELKSVVVNFVPINVVIVVEKLASLFRAEASSLSVSRTDGAELTIPAI